MNRFRPTSVGRFAAAALFAASFAPSAHAAMVMNINATDGDTISSEFQFRVTVQSDNLVTKVEFSINDQFKESSESTPYKFTVDTLNEKEGAYKVTFTAYTSEGESLKKTLNLKIDNGLTKGLDFHLNAGHDALTNSKWDEAVYQGRVALKIDEKSLAGKLILARGYYGKKSYDRAQKYAEDVIAVEPANQEALDLLSVINLVRSFNAGGADAVKTITTAVKAAAHSRRAAIEASVKSLVPPTSGDVLDYADKMISAGHYSLAVDALQDEFQKNTKNTAAANRLLYCQIQLFRLTDADATLNRYEKYGSMDGDGYALKAALAQYLGNTDGSEAAEKEAFLNDPSSLSVKYVQAYLALSRKRYKVFADTSRQIDSQDGASSINNFYQMIVAFLSNNFDGIDQRFETSVLAEPANVSLYIERGNEAIYASAKADDAGRKRAYELAIAYMEAALEAKPDSPEALTGLSLAHALAGHTDQAMGFAQASTRASKEYACGWYAYACAYGMSQKVPQASEILKTAAAVDKRLVGVPVPNPLSAWLYFAQYGRTPIFPAPTGR